MSGVFTALTIANQTTIVNIHQHGLLSRPCLVIAIHGDCPTSPASYQNDFAKEIASRSSNVVAAGLLRPGYKDGQGHRSSGRRGFTVGDNYNRERIDQIANAILDLKYRYSPSKVIIAGHSGGAAITAKLIAYYPDIANFSFIVSCPADINPWRKDMLKLLKYPLFLGKLNVTSPIELVERISDSTGIHVICGADDTVTKPYLSENYVNKLIVSGKQVKYDKIPGAHDLFLSEFVLSSVIKQIESGE
ncbi:alpha/beta hydrolase family protein [Photobacterium nomapromontoriensis]|uniref:alpha/beta hydrolase family protein n=1 Tax=Photobacterium nomapromontoriensis TaxID=2910237 RepID=UPI003D10824A